MNPDGGSSIVVTGAGGLIGGALAGQLADAGITVRGLDRRAGPRVDIVGDLISMPLAKVLEGSDVVVHCASLHAPDVGLAAAPTFVATNVEATRRLLDAARQAGVSKFVFTSTTSVYGHALEDPDRAVWVDESLVPSPRDIYDITKLEAESLVRDHHAADFSTVTLRVARCFPEPWRTTVVNRLHRGVDLRDVISALRLAIDVTLRDHELMNIAGPRVFEPSDVQRLRADPAGVIAVRLPWLSDVFSSRGWRLPETIDRVYVSDRAAAVLNYRPTHGVQAALAVAPGDARRDERDPV